MDKLRISGNKRYFVKEDGTPFVWMADTSWTLAQRMKWDDIIYFCEERARQGFTVLQIVALDPERDLEMRTPAGEPALIDGDLSKPNEAYFQYLDFILDTAEANGFHILLLPVWGQLVVGDDWAGGTFEKQVTEENSYAYARWLGERYKDRKSIIWCLGGDRMPVHKGVDYKKVWRLMAEGLAKGVTGKDLKWNEEDPAWSDLTITYHACHDAKTHECSTMSMWDDGDKWISFIMLQSGHGLEPRNWEIVKRFYDREITMPVWDGEPAYEEMITDFPPTPDTKYHDDWMVRRRAYWSILSGSFGHTYGHASVWCTISDKEKNAFTRCSWFEALHSVGSAQIRHLRGFMESLETMKAVPAQELITEQEFPDDLTGHVAVAQNAGKGYVAAYLPSGGGLALDLDKSILADGELSVWFWNPKDGTYENGSIGGEGSELALETPTSGEGNDWVVIVTLSDKKPVTSFVGAEKKEEAAFGQVFDWG